MPRLAAMESLAAPSAAAALFSKSVLIGLAIAAPVGQIGLLAIQRTLAHGRAAGLATGMSTALADAVYGALGAFGAQALMAWLLGLATWLSLFGGLLLLVLAWRLATRPAPLHAAREWQIVRVRTRCARPRARGSSRP